MIKRLLIITQKVDKNDPVLGFFHRWIEEFAKHLERVEVICLTEGSHAFGSFQFPVTSYPQMGNVQVHSLGKEKGYSKIRQLFWFWKFCWQLSPHVDGVFVHMNAVWVPLGWPLWWLQRKKIIFWRNHPEGGWLARLAYVLADRVFYTSPRAHAAQYAGGKAQRMPAGIDTDFFKKDPTVQKMPNALLYLGRISPVKNIEVIIEAVKLFSRNSENVTLRIIGSPVNPEDVAYEKKLHVLAADLVAKGLVIFSPGVPPSETPSIYNRHEIFINATPTGSFDKTVLEALSCGTLSITSNDSFADILSDNFLFKANNAEDLARVIRYFLEKSPAEKSRLSSLLCQGAVQRHRLSSLMQAILGAFALRRY